jgi:agmatinase
VSLPFDPDAPAAPGAGIFGLNFTEENAAVVLLPVPFEATVSYGGGAARGPEAILHASAQVDLHDLETGRPYEEGIYMRPIPEHLVELDRRAKLEAQKIIAAGGVTRGDRELEAALARVNAAGDEVNEHVYRETRALLERGKIAGIVGGDHSVPFGAIRAYAEKFGDLGILHIDAHADLREAYEGFTWSHASIMNCVMTKIPRVAKLVQIGVRDIGEGEINAVIASNGRISTFVDPLVARVRTIGGLIELFREAVEHLPEHVYVSFDVDGLDPKLCPGTGTPVPGGLELADVSILLEQLVESRRTIVGFDLVEVAPREEFGEWDGNVGARILYKLIGWTLKSRKPETQDHRVLWEKLRHKNTTSRIIV